MTSDVSRTGSSFERFAIYRYCASGHVHVNAPPGGHVEFGALVTIEETGAGTPDKRDVGQPPCRQFKPSRAQIIRYLSKARQTSGQSADATLDWSPCYASGTVRYKDGKTGRWIIQQLGVAYLYIPGREDMLIYCRECSQPPFGF